VYTVPNDEDSSTDMARSHRGSGGSGGLRGGGGDRTEDADVRCVGEGRHDGKYNKLLFGERGQERSHERGS